MFNNISIRIKLSLVIVLTSSVALLLAGGSFIRYELIQYKSAATHEVASLAEVIAASSTAALTFGDERAGRENLAALAADTRIKRAALYDRTNRLFASYTKASAQGSAPPTPKAPGFYFEQGNVLIFDRVLLAGEALGTLYIESDLQEVYGRLWQYAGIVGAVLLASLAFAVLLSSRLQRIFSVPLAELVQTANRVSRERNYSVRAAKHANDELGVLTDAVNEMLNQIERREESLRESEERYAVAARGANDGLWDWKLNTLQIYFSTRWKHMLGHSDEKIGSDPEEWFTRIHPLDRERVESDIARHGRGETAELRSEYRMRHAKGHYIWVLTRGIAIRTAEGVAVRMAGSQTDITEGKVADPLTSLPNRLYFLDRLENVIDVKASNPNHDFAVLFLDLDRFKLINDSLGHGAGDQLLLGISERLRSTIRNAHAADCQVGHSTIARLGGDEFAVLIDDVSGEQDAASVASRILQSLKAPFEIEGRRISATVSIGIAMSASGSTSEELLRNADTAMYQAKSKGKCRFEVFNRHMRDAAITRMLIEGDLQRALETGQFVVHYQPKVSLTSGRITGFEALVRWMHPERGMIGPAEFIPVAEETGAILPLGRWVLQEACRQIAVWNRALPSDNPLTVSVNISFKQLTDPGLTEIVASILDKTGAEPRHLKLEITESSVMENAQASAATLHNIRQLGVGLEIDDFGTGYSSLSYLHQLPFETLKIDRSFVRDLRSDDESLEIITTITKLARSLNMEVVVEGIETGDQLAIVSSLGCALGQGYYFSKPIDAETAWKVIVNDLRPKEPGYISGSMISGSMEVLDTRMELSQSR